VNSSWLPPTHPLAIVATPPPPATVQIDTPVAGTVATTFTALGWAIDPAAAGDVTGINAVFIYAYPGGISAKNPVAVGAATYGLLRQDVANLYGARFANSGYSRSVTLAPGLYDLVVFARKTIDQKWISKVVRITVN
jgi:hypothetical protein